MVIYRRNRVAGASYFFTHVLHDRQSLWLCDHVDLLRAAYGYVQRRWPFETRAIVVLPDHLHCIWTLPPGDDDYAGRWRLIKSQFSALLRRQGVATGCRGAQRRAVWQRRYWEHTLRDERDMNNHLDYIHLNPLKHGLVERVADWPYSSFRRFVERGDLPLDWGGQVDLADGRYGE
jgi:putative transposase